MKKVLLIALACISMAFSANADRLVNLTNRVESNSIKIGVMDGLTRYMKGYTVTIWNQQTGQKLGELSLGLDKYDRLWVINRTSKRLRVPFCYDVIIKGAHHRRWKTVILDPGEYEAPDLELKEGEKLSTNIKAICLTSYSDGKSPAGLKVSMLE